jgi:glycolate oxidase FAD binding subunit
VEYEPGDLTCIVDGDVRLSQLAAILAPQRQRFSLDPPGDPTLEECLLEDLSGPLSHRYGTMRDLVIGVTVVLPDGTRASSGGKVVKNVAGYDLGKLLCGSRGRLGRVERIALRLHPRPDSVRCVVADADRWPWLHRSQLVPSAVDLAGGSLHVRFEGSPRAVDAQVKALGGVDHDTRDDLHALQASLSGRVRWDGQDAPLVRPGRRVAYVRDAPAVGWSPLAERVVEALCSKS